MLLLTRLFRIASEVREADMAFLIPVIAHMIPPFLVHSAATPGFPELEREEIFDDKQEQLFANPFGSSDRCDGIARE
jgi:hypothetical protein